MRKILKIRKTEKGVTILELVIVMTIISIMAVSVFQNFGQTVSSAKLTRAKMDMDEIKKEIKKYAIKSGTVYPTSLNQIKGSFKIPKSPYGSEYTLDTEKEEIVLIYFENNVKKIIRKSYKPGK